MDSDQEVLCFNLLSLSGFYHEINSVAKRLQTIMSPGEDFYIRITINFSRDSRECFVVVLPSCLQLPTMMVVALLYMPWAAPRVSNVIENVLFDPWVTRPSPIAVCNNSLLAQQQQGFQTALHLGEQYSTIKTVVLQVE